MAALGIVAAHLKTRQGLKLYIPQKPHHRMVRCSALENPTGIETREQMVVMDLVGLLQRT